MTGVTLPQHIRPMLATTGTLPPDRGWAFEVKWDGVRAIAYVERGSVRFESRNLIDITPRYPELSSLADEFAGHSAILDGEVVAFDPTGRPDFSTLQRRMHVTDPHAVRARMLDTPVLYVIFDILQLDDEWLAPRPWSERRLVLEGLDLDGPTWRVPAVHDDGAALYAASAGQGLEGVVAKRRAAAYVPGRRSGDWLKVKHVLRQEVVVAGWLPGEGRRAGGIGALVAGYYDDEGRLRYAGKVGTGFTDAELDRVAALLAPLATDTNPFDAKIPHRQARFVEPRLVAEVEFTEWTPDGAMRHPSYKGLRDDKDPSEVRRET